MTTNNKAVTCYLPKDVEGFITRYCTEYGITRKDKEGNILPSLGTAIIELLKLLAYNPELVGSPLPDALPKSITDDAIANSEIIKNIQSRLDNMELLLKLQQSASIASPSPSPDEPAIDTAIEC